MPKTHHPLQIDTVSNETSSSIVPSAYVACLASYNDGILHGRWIALDGSVDIAESIQEILNNSPIPDAEEWAVHGHEYCGELCRVGAIASPPHQTGRAVLPHPAFRSSSSSSLSNHPFWSLL